MQPSTLLSLTVAPLAMAASYGAEGSSAGDHTTVVKPVTSVEFHTVVVTVPTPHYSVPTPESSKSAPGYGGGEWPVSDKSTPVYSVPTPSSKSAAGYGGEWPASSKSAPVYGGESHAYSKPTPESSKSVPVYSVPTPESSKSAPVYGGESHVYSVPTPSSKSTPIYHTPTPPSSKSTPVYTPSIPLYTPPTSLSTPVYTTHTLPTHYPYHNATTFATSYHTHYSHHASGTGYSKPHPLFPSASKPMYGGGATGYAPPAASATGYAAGEDKADKGHGGWGWFGKGEGEGEKKGQGEWQGKWSAKWGW